MDGYGHGAPMVRNQIEDDEEVKEKEHKCPEVNGEPSGLPSAAGWSANPDLADVRMRLQDGKRPSLPIGVLHLWWLP